MTTILQTPPTTENSTRCVRFARSLRELVSLSETSDKLLDFLETGHEIGMS
jgi:hypothetical protein